MIPRQRHTFALTALAAMGLAFLPAASMADEEAEKPSREQVLRQHFASLTAGTPIQSGPLTVIPLNVNQAVASVDLTSGALNAKIEIEAASRRRPVVRIQNDLATPIFLAAGRVLGSQSGADIILGRDVIVPAKGKTVADALPGSFANGKVKAGEPLTVHPRYAPPALREAVISDGTSYDVKTFLALFSEVAGDDEDRIPTLRQVLESDFARNLDTEVTQALHSPHLDKQMTVGFAVGVFGRLTTLQTFATPNLMRENLAEILGSHGIYAAAMMVRARDIGVPMKRGNDATAAVSEEANELLAKLKSKADADGSDDKTISLSAPAVVGHGIWHKAVPAHIVVYPHDPYERALFARTFDMDALDDTEIGDETSERMDESTGELERRADRGTQTEYEKRLLDRRRANREGK